MFTKELLEKIKNVTAEILFTKEKEVEVTFATERLKDSDVEIKYSELAVGNPVFQASKDGNVAVEDGTYTTDSGVSFTTKDGLISKVIEAPEAEVEKEELAKEDEVEKPVEEAKEEEKLASDNSELLAKIESLEAEIASIKEALKPKEDSKDEAFAKLDGEVKAIAELLSAIAKTPVEFSKTDNRAEANDSKNDKLKALADIISFKK